MTRRLSSAMTYAYGPELDMSEISATPQYQVSVESSNDEWGTVFGVTATMCGAELGAGKDATELNRAQCLAVWGVRMVEAAEEAFADAFDAQAALADEADDRGDYEYEKWRDDQGEAA